MEVWMIWNKHYPTEHELSRFKWGEFRDIPSPESNKNMNDRSHSFNSRMDNGVTFKIYPLT